MPYVMGIDVGTTGARVLIADADGKVLANARRPLGPGPADVPEGWAEQEPRGWWRATVECVREALGQLRENAGAGPESIAALACDGTSGTVLFLDAANRPLGRAIMYNDGRAGAEAEEANATGARHCERFGYRFSPTWALPKVLWVKRRRPQLWARTYCIAHATDYITGMICGDFRVSDTSTCLKTGCDLEDASWPEFIETELSIPRSLLPRLVLPGETIGQVCPAAADATGLSTGTAVHAGATDGTAALFASGASRVGEFNCNLGTTLVLKGISAERISDPLGRIYCHRHPAGHWLPGGASSTGGECVSSQFGHDELPGLNAAVLDGSPTSLVCYPLLRRGERMPFADPEAEGFLVGRPRDRREHYTACLEGVACIERMSIELLESLGATVSDPVYVTGGGVNSPAWLQVRADVLNRGLVVPEVEETAFGACLLAATGSIHEDMETASRHMVRTRDRVLPRPRMRSAYDALFGRFVAEMANRGYEVRQP